MTTQGETTGGLVYKDRKGGLVAFGIIEILLGALCALAIPFMIFAMVMTNSLAQQGGTAPMSIGSMFFSVLIYGLAAAFFIVTGIGSIRARRWARALMLVGSWMWLIIGIISLIMVAVIMPGIMSKTMGAAGKSAGGMEFVAIGFMMFFMLIFYVLIPGAFVFFYRSPHVKATCERINPAPCWTDRCPLPVLALVLLFGYGACCMPAMGLYNWAMPFFGHILSGAAGAVVVLVNAAVWAWVTIGLFRLKIAAWWTAVLAILFWGASSAITFTRMSIIDFYAQMKFPPEQLEQIKLFIPEPAIITGMMLVSILIFLGYIVYTKRFFAPAPPPGRA